MITRKCIPVLLVLTFLLCFTVASDLMAYSLGKNITIRDNNSTSSSSSNTWYSNLNEDQEVEPNCSTGQYWDLEGFFLNGTQLSMVGGYDFKKGYDGTTGGDIFIGPRNLTTYGIDNYSTPDINGNNEQSNIFGYTYAIRLDFVTMSYTVYSLNANSKLSTGFYRQNDEANPWQTRDYSNPLPYASGEFSYDTNQSDAQIGYGITGDSHNVISGLDLSFLGSGQEFTAHYTMSCGNDNLMGQGKTVPEPASLFLLGTGLFGLAAGTRMRRVKK